MLEASVYLLFCLLTGLCGIHRRMGFFGTFLLSLVVTPVAVLLVLLLTGPKQSHAHYWGNVRDSSSPQGN
jgi:hypothetical protein